MSEEAPTATADRPSASAAKPWDLYTRRQRSTFLLVLFLVGTSNYVDRNIIGVLLEPIKQEFGVSDTMLGLLSGINSQVRASARDGKVILTIPIDFAS